MARNEEKHFCKLNRIILKQQKDEEKKKNPKRPHLSTLSTAVELKRWLPTIKKDIDFYIKQSKVWCYPERKISEFNLRIDQLRREHQAFVWKLRQVDPTCEVLPGTDRPYAAHERPGVETSVAETDAHDVKSQGDAEKNTVSEIPKKTFKRIPLPLLHSAVEHQYAQELKSGHKRRAVSARTDDSTDKVKLVGSVNTECSNKTFCDRLNASSQDLPLDFNVAGCTVDTVSDPNQSIPNSALVHSEVELRRNQSHPLGLDYASSSEEESPT